MKIHLLEIENLASLKGIHKIDFDQLLSGNNLFAITGDTGSGKSTLLNAISLALYGQNYKTSINQTDYVTLGESVAKINITFSIGLKKYIAHWSCRLKKKSGEDLKNPLTRRDFFIIEGNRTISLDYNPEKVIKLSFDQFCKTIILNQGQFAKFLTSSFTERKDIIERLYQGELLEKLSPTLKKQINDINQKIALYQSNLDGINVHNLLSKEELNNLKEKKEKIYNHSAEIKEITKKLNEYFIDLSEKDNHLETNLKRIQSLNHEILQFTTDSNIFKNRYEKKESELIKLNKEFKTQFPILQECITKYNELTIHKNNIDELERKKANSIIELNEHKQKLEDLDIELSIDLKELTELKNHLTFNLNPNNIKLTKDLIKQLKDIQIHLSKYDTERKTLQKNLADFELQGSNTSSKIAILKKEIEILEKENHKEQLIETDIALQSTNNCLTQIVFLENKRLDLISKIETISNQSLVAENNILNEEDNLKENLEKIVLLENSTKLYKLEMAINLCKTKSIEQHQCIICNSKDLNQLHYSNDFNPNNLQKYELELEDEKKQNQQILEKLNSFKLNKKQLEKSILEIKNEYKTIINKFNIDFNQNISIDINKTLQDFKNDISSDIAKTNAKLEKLKKDIESLTIKNLEYENQNIFITGLRKQYANINIQIEQVTNSSLKLSEQQLKVLFEIKSNLELSNEIKIEQIEKIEFELLQFEKINALEQISNQKNKHIQDLKSTYNDLERRIQEYQIECKKTKEVIQSISTLLDKKLNGKDPTLVLKNLQDNIELISNECNVLKEKLKSIDIEKAQADSKLKMGKEQIQQLNIDISALYNQIQKESQNLLERHEPELIEINTSLLRSLSNLNMPNEFKMILNFSQEVETIYIKTKEVCEIFKEELIQIKQRIIDRTSVDEKIKNTQHKISSLTSQKNKKDDLNKLIGKDEFRNYVLSLIEKELIHFTNNELQKLCNGRYEIVHFNKNKVSPDFYIIDKLKEGLTRKVSTLSGGETFMVSLAMALALAEMTRGQNEIDSFFIDEGFGTLDSESIDNVLEMLNNLHIRGKQIGIISHVKQLTERITTNIRLKKNQLGASEIELLLN